jgi:predicted transcriptional regulator
MTDEEYVGILTAAKTDVSVAAWVETFNIVSQVNLNDPRTKSGLDMMVSKGLLTAERETKILTAPVQPNERP